MEVVASGSNNVWHKKQKLIWDDFVDDSAQMGLNSIPEQQMKAVFSSDPINVSFLTDSPTWSGRVLGKGQT